MILNTDGRKWNESRLLIRGVVALFILLLGIIKATSQIHISGYAQIINHLDSCDTSTIIVYENEQVEIDKYAYTPKKIINKNIQLVHQKQSEIIDKLRFVKTQQIYYRTLPSTEKFTIGKNHIKVCLSFSHKNIIARTFLYRDIIKKFIGSHYINSFDKRKNYLVNFSKHFLIRPPPINILYKMYIS